MSDYKATGGCLCGNVKYEITQAPTHVHYCHCWMCRKRIGADFVTAGSVSKEHFKLIKDESLKEYQTSENGTVYFCHVCGCSLFAKGREGGKLADLKCVFLFLGSLDADPGAPPTFHIFVKSKAPWVKINDGLPQSDEGELLKFEELM